MRITTRRRSSGFTARSSNSLRERRSCSNTDTLRVGEGRSDAYHTRCWVLGARSWTAYSTQHSGPRLSMSLVALSATTKVIDGLMRVRLNEAYVDAVRAAGLTPLVLPPLEIHELEAVASVVSGVVLTGGEDIDPAEYGAERNPKTTDVHQRRDKCELSLAQLAHERRLPTLAICRGIQLVNVAFGGTLVQDIPSECPSAIDHDQSKERTMRVHDVSI